MFWTQSSSRVIAQPQVLSTLSCTGNKDGVKTWQQPLFSIPVKNTFKKVTLGLISISSLVWGSWRKKLVLGPVGWQLPGWCYRVEGPPGPAGAMPQNYCNYQWGGKKPASAPVTDMSWLIDEMHILSSPLLFGWVLPVKFKDLNFLQLSVYLVNTIQFKTLKIKR